jgi:cytochrome c biogenesis protein CcdA/thiol-disulfide isomerase/thioredoxin
VALLLVIGFLAGVITAISPCVLPVLPILLAGGASGGSRRPYAIIAGLVASFVVFTLTAAWVLERLGLPRDLLRNAALVLLFVVAATLLVPPLGRVLERPFAALTRRRPGDAGGGFVLGLSLGLVFVPCAGPVLAYITVAAASQDVDAKAVLLTVAYALGAAVPMLAVAVGGQRVARRFRSPAVRPVLGAVVATAAVAIVFELDVRAQTALGDYTAWLQGYVERTDFAERRLARAGEGVAADDSSTASLADFGPAPELRGIHEWLNRPGGRPLTLAGLRGRVVLIDFWTYSCINCLRTLPHLRAWHAAYRDDGLVIVGVHSPEFAFEHEADNVRGAVRRLGIRYPVALDNDFATWNAFGNRYWPAKYLIDRGGHVRYAHFGEGAYRTTEMLIRRLLELPAPQRLVEASLADATPTGQLTPESYLGYLRLDRFAGGRVTGDRAADYRFPATLDAHELAYAGRWRVERERIVAVENARVRIRYRARDVFLVLGGRGTVDVTLDRRRVRTVRVAGHRLYTLVDGDRIREALLELRFARGVEGYAFTFG